MVERVALGVVVIQSLNTPKKNVGDTLFPTPRWRYKGPACTISLTYQVGYKGVTFNGMSPRLSMNLNQPASPDWAEFTPISPLIGVSLTGLTLTEDNRYDMEMIFRSAAFADQTAYFMDCCEVPAAVAALEIVSCSFS